MNGRALDHSEYGDFQKPKSGKIGSQTVIFLFVLKRVDKGYERVLWTRLHERPTRRIVPILGRYKMPAESLRNSMRRPSHEATVGPSSRRLEH